jgi:hypothetical protein
MPKQPKRGRLNLRVPQHEIDQWHEQAARAGITVSDLVRLALRGVSIITRDAA